MIRGERRAGECERERGFTLIELMVALVVSSLLVGMIFAIFIRMSTAYRSQQQVAEVQGKLAAARARIEQDVKLAGLRMTVGFHLAPGVWRPALRVINNADAPDELELFYADPAVQVVVIGTSPATCTQVACDQLTATDGFVAGDLVVMSTPHWDPPELGGGAKIARFDACVLEIASVGPNQLAFSTDPPWGTLNNSFCPNPPHSGTDPNRGRTVFSKLAARRWRIDPARPADGVLQLSTLGTLTGAADWQDQAYGFTDLQIATRLYDPTEPADLDLDSDPARDWYSGEAQEPAAAPAVDPRVPLQISISLVARTERDVEGIASVSTPSLTVAGNEQHNTVGDRAAIPLPSPLPALAGDRIYRHTTFQVDLRNLGVGR